MPSARGPVWVVESSTIFRRGMSRCLHERGITVAGDSATLPHPEDLPGVALLVIDLAGDGIAAAAAARVAGGGPKLVGIVPTDRPHVFREAVDAGFSGLLCRSELTPAGLVGVVQVVLSGAGSPPVLALTRMLTDAGHPSRPCSDHGFLTPREMAVLRLLSQGSSVREIAGELCCSERTVKSVVHDALMMLNCRTRTQAVAVLTRRGAL